MRIFFLNIYFVLRQIVIVGVVTGILIRLTNTIYVLRGSSLVEVLEVINGQYYYKGIRSVIYSEPIFRILAQDATPYGKGGLYEIIAREAVAL